jgi:hypothetical protein
MKFKNLKFTAFFLLLALLSTFTAIASAEGVRKRIKFARGKSSATVSGAVVRGDQDTYIIGAREGQKMTVRITSPEKNAVFQIKKSNGDFLSGASEGDDAASWSDALLATGDYEIVVGGTRGNASYKLTVAIK